MAGYSSHVVSVPHKYNYIPPFTIISYQNYQLKLISKSIIFSRRPRPTNKTAICLLSGVLIFPAGWDSAAVKEVCGNEAGSYNVGQCSIRWAYILAIIGVVDCGVLSILAFVLGTRYAKLLPEPYQMNSGSSLIGKGESNPTFITDQYNNNYRKSSMMSALQQQHPPMPVPIHHSSAYQ